MKPQHRGLTSSVLALLVVTGAGYLDYFILQNGLPHSTDTANVVVMILTAWNGIAAMVCNYYYGASHDARPAAAKTEEAQVPRTYRQAPPPPP
jgi:hypothetical protein